MPKGKIRETFHKKLEHKKNIENDWQSFLIKDTYLIFDEKLIISMNNLLGHFALFVD